jgi:gluconate 2-dehydrogenase gamma chain
LYRREFISIASMMLGGLVHTRALAALLNGEKQYLFKAPDFIQQSVSEFSPAQRQRVSAIVDIIIPATANSPGALDAAVPKFIELLVANWMTDDERTEFKRGLEEIDQLARQRHKEAFVDSDPKQRQALLETFEARYSDHPWYQQGRVDTPGSYKNAIPFIAQLKELTVFGFFMSEVGCKQALRYNPMPGRFEADIPLDQNDSSWTPTPLM